MDVVGQAPHAGLEHPATVEREAGDQVEHADDEVGAARAADRHADQPAGGDEGQQVRGADADTMEVSGPTTAIMNSSRGRLASPSIAVMPPRKWSVMERDGVAVVLGHQRVGSLVQEDREIEDDCEGEPADVLQRAESRLCFLDGGRDDDRDQGSDHEPRRS